MKTERTKKIIINIVKAYIAVVEMRYPLDPESKESKELRVIERDLLDRLVEMNTGNPHIERLDKLEKAYEKLS